VSYYLIKNKTNNKRNKQTAASRPAQNGNKKNAKGSLGRTLLKAGLTGLGGMFGPLGAGVGSSLGDWGSTILGMGDYKIESNSLMDGSTGVPRMHEGKRSVRISHREFLGDITGSTAFTNRLFTINPGSSTTFPWLSNIAYMFQSYKLHGLIFEFVSSSADALNSVNTALGTVVMATQYNVALPQFLNKPEAEQHEFTCAGRPSRNLIHGVECNPRDQVMDHLFTRTGALPAGQDYQFYDWGNFQLMTVGMQAAAVIGELWVSYDIEFLKPRIQSGGTWPGDFTRISNGPYVAATDVLGSIQTTPVGTLGITVSAGAAGWQRILFPSNISAGRFLVTVEWDGAVTAAIAISGRTYSNLTQVASVFNLGTSPEMLVPAAGNVARKAQFTTTVTVNGYSATGSYIEFDAAGTLPATPTYVQIYVVGIPMTDNSF
jgi:hypothetical protein